MKSKVLLEAKLRRKIPSHFSWVDHRLVRDGFTRKCSVESLGLYLFLVTVSDSEGLSYYGERRIAQELNCPEERVAILRSDLIAANLIAYKNGIYQVLELSEQKSEYFKNETNVPVKAGDVVMAMLERMKHG